MTEEYNKFLQRQEEQINREIIVVSKRKVSETFKCDESIQNNEQNKKLKPELEEATSNDLFTTQVITKHAKYVKTKFNSRDTPKSLLHTYTMKMNWSRPVYKTEEKGPQRVFKSSVEVNNVVYATPYW